MPASAVLEDYLEFLRFGSISTDSQHKGQVEACAEWLRGKLVTAGLDARVLPTAGHSVVLARGPHRAGRPTVLIYGHYDVQPVDPVELWTHPPFAPHVENGVVTARGASDNKGQIFAHIQGVAEVLRDKGDLPVNLIFLVEGEEEIGSPNLAAFLREHQDELKCDVIVISDSSMIAPGHPTFTYGLRGLAALEVHVTGPDRDLHSGIFGGAVENPATVLARLIAGLHDKNLKVAIDGFYDGVQPIASWERRGWRKLPLNDETLLRMTGVAALRGEAKFTPLERIWARPTAEVNGLGSGYQGEGTKTVLPSRAMAKLTFRLVPGQDPQHVQELAAAYFRDHAPPSVKIETVLGHCGAPYVVDPHAGFGMAAQKALKRAIPGQKVALIREGGTIPIVADFKKILGVDTLLLGLCLADCNAHSPNETFPIEHLDLGARLNKFLLQEIAKAASPAVTTTPTDKISNDTETTS